jgi:hypothetical protein
MFGETSRRAVVRTAAATLVGAGGAAAFVTTGSEPAMAASFDQESVHVTTHDGRVKDVTITPELTLSWEGANTTLGHAAVRIEATNDGSTGTVLERADLDVPNEADASRTYDEFETRSIIEDGPYERADFRATGDGETVETEVRLTLTAALNDTNDEQVATTTAHPTFVVRVTNNEVTVEVTGEMNPEVETATGDD